jgi:hypothetical protein
MSLARNNFMALVSGLAVLAGAGCSDSGSAPDARTQNMFDATCMTCRPDAKVPDAAVPDAAPPDAPPDQPFEGTIAVTDVKVTNDLTAFGIPALSGGSVSISFDDPDTGKGVRVFGDGSIGTCTVLEYTVTDAANPLSGEPTLVDEGAVAIAGATTPTFPAPCAFNAAKGDYLCIEGGAATIAGSTIGPVPMMAPLAAYTPLPAQTFGDPVGFVVNVAGFGAGVDGTFPIAGENGGSLIVIDPTVPMAGAAQAGAGQFAIIGGAGPTPVARPFLASGATITLTKAAGAHTPTALNSTVIAAGSGLKLADGSAKPEALPTTATADFAIGCSGPDVGANGNCGSAGGALTGFIVTVRTTDTASSPMLPPFTFPNPTTKYATMTCTGIGATEIKIPKQAWAAVLATNPKRIQTRVIRATADLGTAPYKVIAGHALVGFTTLP